MGGVDSSLINLIGSIVGGGISAILGAYAYHWLYTKSLRTRIINALKNELRLNIARIEKNLKALNEKDSEETKKAVLVFPFVTRVYESMLIEDPRLLYEMSQITNGKIDEIYEGLSSLNAIHIAMLLNPDHSVGHDKVLMILILFKKQIKDILELLERMYPEKKR